MKRFFGKLLLLAPILFGMVAANWLIDPVHLRDADQYERGIAQLILAGQGVTNIWNPNEAAYLEAYLDGLQQHKDVLVLGSSRSKLIRSDSFPGLTFFNNSIGGAGLTDYLAIYELYRQKNLIPAIVVIELSPWVVYRDYASKWEAFNSHRDALERRVLHPGLDQNQPIQIGRTASTDWAEFLSPGYFQTSFYSWLRGTLKPAENKAAYFEYKDGDLPVGETILSDGSTIYPERVQNTLEVERVTAQAIEYAQNPAGIPTELDANAQKVLEGFVDYLRQQGVRVIFYLPPYHPKAYELLVNSKRYQIITAIQKYFEDLAKRKDLTLIGSYNPAALVLDQTAFFDGSHPTQDAVRSLFAGTIQGTPQGAASKVTDQIQVVGVNNPNGLEVVNNRPFFWIGQGSTCLAVRSSRAGAATLTLQASPGPGIPETAQRNLRVSTALGYTTTVLVANYPTVEIHVLIQPGINEVCLTPLDKPTVLDYPNGDQRPLLLGISEVRIQLAPQELAGDGHVCELTFSTGWYQVEHAGTNELRWNTGRGLLNAFVDTDTSAVLLGQINSIQRPNKVDVIVNDQPVTTLPIDWEEWMVKPFTPLTLSLKAGPNTIEFVSHNPPITQTTDARLLAIAIQDLQLLNNGQPCKIQP